MTFDDVFGPLSESELAEQARQNAIKSVQSSLWRHLKSAGVPRSGAVSWVLVRLADLGSPKYGSAIAALSKRPPRELQILMGCARSAHSSKRADAAWKRVTTAILEEMSRMASSQALSSPLEVAPAARASLPAVELVAFDLGQRRDRRALELFRSGVPAEDAGRQAYEEITS